MFTTNQTKEGALYFEESYHFPFPEMWDSFVKTLDMNDEKIRLLVEEVDYQRKIIAEYYEKEIATL